MSPAVEWFILGGALDGMAFGFYLVTLGWLISLPLSVVKYGLSLLKL